jgi:hypothetical protein
MVMMVAIVGPVAAAPVPLAEAMGTAWPGAQWPTDRAEIANYTAETVVAGVARRHEVTMVATAVQYNRAARVVAAWPIGDKPVEPALRAVTMTSIPGPNGPTALTTALVMRRDAPMATLRLDVTVADWEGVALRSLEPWESPPRWVERATGEPGGVTTTTVEGALFEEQLPWVLRALDFREGLEARLAIHAPQSRMRAAAPSTPAQALLTVTAEGSGIWRVRVEADDNRQMQFDFEQEWPHRLRAATHSDGRSLQLVGAMWDAFWEVRQ